MNTKTMGLTIKENDFKDYNSSQKICKKLKKDGIYMKIKV